MTEQDGNGNYSAQAMPPIERQYIGGGRAGGSCELSLDTPPIAQGLELVEGQTGSVLGVVELGRQYVGVIKVDPGEGQYSDDTEPRYALARVGYNPSLPEGEQVTIIKNDHGTLIGNWLAKDTGQVTLGRDTTTEGYGSVIDPTDGYTSGKHLGLSLDAEAGTLIIDDLNSTNGTALIARKAEQDTPHPNYTAWLDDDPTVTAPAAEVVNNPEILEVAEEVGEVAVESSTEEQFVDIDANGEAPVAPNETSQLDPEKVQAALVELTNTWGLPAGTSLEGAIKILDGQADKITSALKSLDEFEPTVQATALDIKNSLNRQTNALRGSSRDAMSAFIGGNGMRGLTELARVDTSVLPPHTKRQLAELGNVMNRIRSTYDATVARGRTWFDGEAATQLKRQLDTMPRHKEDVKDALREVQQMQLRLKGSMTEMGAAEVKGGKEAQEYRNETVRQWAEALSRDDITAEQLEEVTAAMQASVLMESSMRDDPNSPYKWFGERVRSNDSKERAQVQFTGRKDRINVPSTRYVAELMTDMLRGKFKVDANGVNEAITLSDSSVGGVVLGQHRAAALAMLYGNKDWQRIAKEKGFKIEAH